jgi:glycosyltransferase involved in cell wall biosynthesis
MRYIDEYYCKYPDMRKRVHFLGAIEDKLQLWSLYEKSRMFILSSRWEGFSIAAVEAIANGCYPVLTDAVISKDVITNNYSFGKIAAVENFKALSKAILEAIVDLSITREEDIHETIRSYAFDQFEWGIICERLYKALTLRMV